MKTFVSRPASRWAFQEIPGWARAPLRAGRAGNSTINGAALRKHLGPTLRGGRQSARPTRSAPVHGPRRTSSERVKALPESLSRSPRRWATLALIIWLGSLHLNAAVLIWQGVGNRWSSSVNWTPAQRPANGDDLVFPSGSPTLSSNDLPNLRLKSLTFDETHTLRGNPIVLSNGIACGESGDTINVEVPLTLGANQTFKADYCNLYVSTTLDVNGFDLTLISPAFNVVGESPRRVGIYSVITGTGAIRTRGGQGWISGVQIGGPFPNPFTGPYIAEGGYLILDKISGGAIHSRLEVGGTNFGSPTVVYLRPNQLDDGADVLVRRNGVLDLNGYNDTFASLEMQQSSRVTMEQEDGDPSSTLTLTSRLAVRATNAFPAFEEAAVINGNLAIAGQIPFQIDGDEIPACRLIANVSGGGFVKRGGGTLALIGTNSFTGEARIAEGTVDCWHASAFGSTVGGTVLDGGRISLQGLAIGTEPLSVIDSISGSSLLAFNECSWAGPINLGADLALYAIDAGFIGSRTTLSGAISGSGDLNLESPIFGVGTVRLAGTQPNTYTGATRLNNTLLELAKSSNIRAFSGPLFAGGAPGSALREVRWLNHFQLPPLASLTVNTNGLFALNNFTDIAANLNFAGGRVNLATDSALTITDWVQCYPTNHTAVIDGATGLGSLFLSGARWFNVSRGSGLEVDLRIDARVAGTALTKIGAGTLALRGPNQYAGLTTISNGLVRAEHNTALGSASSGTVVHPGAALWIGGAATTIAEPLTLNAAGPGGTNGSLVAANIASLTGSVALQSPSTVRTDAGAHLSINSVISGTGPLTKTGPGTLTLGGAVANTFSGDTLVHAGLLQLNKAAFVQAVPGNLIIGPGGLVPPTTTVRHLNQDQIWSSVTVNGGGLLDVNGFEEYLLALTLNDGGDVQTGPGLVTLDGNNAGNSLTVNPGLRAASSTLTGRIAFRLGNHRIAVGATAIPDLSGAPELDIPAAIVNFDGLANLHKNGPGTMRLRGANSFTGLLNLNAGTTIAAHNSALGTTQGSTVVQSNATLLLDGGIVTGEFLLLDTSASPALGAFSGSNTVTAGVNLLRPDNTIQVPTGSQLQITGQVGGPGGLRKTGGGTLQFSGAIGNSYGGLTTVQDGTLECARSGAIAIPGDAAIGEDSAASPLATLRALRDQQFRRTATFTVRRRGFLDLFPVAPAPPPQPTLRAVPGSGTISLGAGTSLTLSNDLSFEFSGSIQGPGALHKFGAGTMSFTGDSSFGGLTTIWQGPYRLDGNSINSPVLIKAGGSLRGDGWSGNVTVESDGLIDPSSESPGRLGGDLQVASLAVQSGGIINPTFFGPHPTGGNDTITASGAVSLNSARLNAGFQYAPSEGDVLLLIRKVSAGTVTGAFNGWAQGTVQTLDGIPVAMSYIGGDGNDVTLTVTNLAAAAAGTRVDSGNGNGLIEPDECNLVYLGVQNRRNTPITLTGVELRSTTPGALVTIATAAYPVLPAASIRTNTTPFQIRTSAQHPCGAPVSVELRVTIAGEGTFSIPFTLVGGTDCSRSGGACESCTSVVGSFSPESPVLPQPLLATGTPSTCFPPKPCPGSDPATNLPPTRWTQHLFTNQTATELCLTAQLSTDCSAAPPNTFQAAAYLGQFDPASPCANYLGDTGLTGPGPQPSFAFRVPAGQRFVVVISLRNPAGTCPNYRLEVFGLPCPPPTLSIDRPTTTENPGQVVVQWSTAYPGWTLQSAAGLPIGTLADFEPTSASPFVTGGRYTVTNQPSQPRQFYRLKR